MCVPQCVYMWIESPQYEYVSCTSLPDAGQVVVDRALRRVRHPDPVRRVARRDPRRHADEVLDVEVEHVAAVEVLEDGAVRLRRDPVEATDLVVRAPRALRDLETVLLENCLVGEALPPPWPSALLSSKGRPSLIGSLRDAEGARSTTTSSVRTRTWRRTRSRRSRTRGRSRSNGFRSSCGPRHARCSRCAATTCAPTGRSNVYRLALERGIEIHLPRYQPRSTLPLAACLWAGEQGRLRAFKHALYEAFFCEGEDIADRPGDRPRRRRVGARPRRRRRRRLLARTLRARSARSARRRRRPACAASRRSSPRTARTHWGMGGLERATRRRAARPARSTPADAGDASRPHATLAARDSTSCLADGREPCDACGGPSRRDAFPVVEEALAEESPRCASERTVHLPTPAGRARGRARPAGRAGRLPRPPTTIRRSRACSRPTAGSPRRSSRR